MSLRSFLFVPGDSERKQAKAETNQADALILDLEDSVSPENIDRARVMVREYLQARRPRGRQQLWVRINPIQTEKALADLAAIMPGAPDGIMLPKADSAAEAITLGHYLSALEAREGLTPESTRILPVATETPRAMFALGSYHGASARLYRPDVGRRGSFHGHRRQHQPAARRRVRIHLQDGEIAVPAGRFRRRHCRH